MPKRHIQDFPRRPPGPDLMPVKLNKQSVHIQTTPDLDHIHICYRFPTLGICLYVMIRARTGKDLLRKGFRRTPIRGRAVSPHFPSLSLNRRPICLRTGTICIQPSEAQTLWKAHFPCSFPSAHSFK